MQPDVDEITYEIPPSYIDSAGELRRFQLDMIQFIKGSEKIAILSAPTGAGKTHGFRLMGEAGNTVMIVFPNNLLSNETFSAFKKEDGNDVALLNASSINRLMHEKRSMGFHDFSQRRAIGSILENKKFIITNPTVFYRLLNNYYSLDSKEDMLSELMKRNVSCIIFDEFHIYSRDQASILLASTLLVRKDVKLIFSSATLPDYLDSLLAQMYGADRLCKIYASRTSVKKPDSVLLQGRINIHIVRGTATDFIRSRSALFRMGKWFLILDSIKNIQEAFHSLVRELDPSEIAVISAYHDPSYETYIDIREGISKKRIIIGSNIVEQGINPPDEYTNFIIEPGYSPESFIQRSGRIGRGSLETCELYVAMQSQAGGFPDHLDTIDDLYRLISNFRFRNNVPPSIESLGTYLWFILNRLTRNAAEAVIENLENRQVDRKLLAACFRTKKVDNILEDESWIKANARFVGELTDISNWWRDYKKSIYNFIPEQNEVRVLDTSEDFVEYGNGFMTEYSEIWIRKNKEIVSSKNGIMIVKDFLSKADYDFDVYVSGLPFGAKVKMKYGEIYFRSRKEIISRFDLFYKRYFSIPDNIEEILEGLRKCLLATAGSERLKLELP